MSGKKKKYNCRFPPARIKKIMQADEEVGKVAAVVPLIISRALELFVEALLTESSKITIARSARTLTPPHLKACISSNSQFSFLKDFVSTIPDIPATIDDEQSDGNSSGAALLSSSSAAPTTVGGTGTIPGQPSSGIQCKMINRSNSRTSHFSFNKQTSNPGSTATRARGRPRKLGVITSGTRHRVSDDTDDINDEPEPRRKSVTQEDDDDYETLDEDTEEESSCDNSTSTSFTNPSSTCKSLQNPKTPTLHTYGSFSLALNQQIPEDDDYDN
ncbi:negative cofactor 2 alpha [Brevipalpus obovatus]|uniref:negative cofactor 2 alpha n=1 Tax=Brevipalpus obovatus TaxID=246614 RepID=UPI003D9EC2A0